MVGKHESLANPVGGEKAAAALRSNVADVESGDVADLLEPVGSMHTPAAAD